MIFVFGVWVSLYPRWFLFRGPYRKSQAKLVRGERQHVALRILLLPSVVTPENLEASIKLYSWPRNPRAWKRPSLLLEKLPMSPCRREGIIAYSCTTAMSALRLWDTNSGNLHRANHYRSSSDSPECPTSGEVLLLLQRSSEPGAAQKKSSVWCLGFKYQSALANLDFTVFVF